MKEVLSLFLILIFTQARETIVEPIRTWKTFPIPDKEKAWSYNRGNSDWTVFDKESELYVTNEREFSPQSLPFKINQNKKEFDKFSGKQSVIEVEDGYLLGVYRGEWGGNLWWFSKDGKKHYEISNDKIVTFIQRDNRIFAIQGLAHLSSSRGSIIEIIRGKNEWTREEYLVLPSAPDGIDVYNNEFIIVTSKSLIKVDTEKNIHYLIEKGFWSGLLYPTSLVVKENNAFVGMRKGVLKYNLTNDEQAWLMR